MQTSTTANRNGWIGADPGLVHKYKQLKRRIRDIDKENTTYESKLHRAKQHIKRLRAETSLLLETLQETKALQEPHFCSDSEESMTGLSRSRKRPHSHLHERITDKTTEKPMDSGSSHSTPRKKKDPLAPKGPGNVFFLFCRMERDKIKDTMPSESLGDITRALGQQWKALSKQEKQIYHDLYKKERVDYEVALKTYTDAGGGDAGVAAVDKSQAILEEEEEESESEEEEEEEDEVDMLEEEEEEEEKEEEPSQQQAQQQQAQQQPPLLNV
ncbi:high mobility group box domain-containing protein [Spinellus fusiger]|nr:high mobility group box domain-containing protein [Spinellus fusiger]